MAALINLQSAGEKTAWDSYPPVQGTEDPPGDRKNSPGKTGK